MEEDKKKLIAIKRSASEEEVPDFYVNSVRLLTSQYELLLQFGLKTHPEEDPKSVVNIRMSPQHAKVMTLILKNNIREYEKNIGVINLLPQLISDLKLDEEV